MLPMASGILEMFIRTIIISYFISRIGFAATAYTEIGAWLGALLINAYAFYIAMAPLLSKDNKTSYHENKGLHRRAMT